MYFVDYIVDGFTFIVCSDGLVIPPSLMNESSPEFFRALQKMMLVFPDAARIETFLEFNYSNQLEDAKSLQKEWLIKYGFEHELLAKYIQKWLEPTPKKPKKVIKHPGYIYLVESDHGYKIGLTKNPEDRIKTFEVKLPFEVEYVCLIPTSDMYKLERDLHERFAGKRVNGEWFNLGAADVEYMQSLAEANS